MAPVGPAALTVMLAGTFVRIRGNRETTSTGVELFVVVPLPSWPWAFNRVLTGAVGNAGVPWSHRTQRPGQAFRELGVSM